MTTAAVELLARYAGALRALQADDGPCPHSCTRSGTTVASPLGLIAKLGRETGTALWERRGAESGTPNAPFRRHGMGVARARGASEDRVGGAIRGADRAADGGSVRERGAGSDAGRTCRSGEASFCGQHPLSEVDPHLSVDLVGKGAVDTAIAHDWDITPLPAPPGVEQAVIGDDPCDLLVPVGHLDTMPVRHLYALWPQGAALRPAMRKRCAPSTNTGLRCRHTTAVDKPSSSLPSHRR